MIRETIILNKNKSVDLVCLITKKKEKERKAKTVVVTEPGKNASYILEKISILTKNHLVHFVNGTLPNYSLK